MKSAIRIYFIKRFWAIVPNLHYLTRPVLFEHGSIISYCIPRQVQNVPKQTHTGSLDLSCIHSTYTLDLTTYSTYILELTSFLSTNILDLNTVY